MVIVFIVNKEKYMYIYSCTCIILIKLIFLLLISMYNLYDERGVYVGKKKCPVPSWAFWV